MKLRAVRKSDYDLILKLDEKVYPVPPENKINSKIIDHWYTPYKNYGMIYVKSGYEINKVNKELENENENEDIVAMAIVIPMPIDTWEKLIAGECFEHSLPIDWSSTTSITNNNDKVQTINIGIHIYHIEVLKREEVGRKFYLRMLNDLVKISRNYKHHIQGFSGYCVTPEGNHLFKNILKCQNTDDDVDVDDNDNSNSKNNNYNNDDDTNKSTPLTSEYIVWNPITKERKIIIHEIINDNNTNETIYLDESVSPPQTLYYLSKCNMFYTKRYKKENKNVIENENKNKNENDISPVWKYL